MRGEVWTVAGAGYASKPRPAIVVQSDETDSFDSTIICLLTTDASVSGRTRVELTPTPENGLDRTCHAMAEKVLAIKKSSLGRKIGTMSQSDMERISIALRAAMGL